MTEQDFRAKEQTFRAMSPEEREKFVNERLMEGKSNKQVAEEEFNRSASWLNERMKEAGYTKQKGGLYVKNEDESMADAVPSHQEAYTAMLELLQYKDALLALVRTNQASEKPDFSLLDRYDEEETISRTYALPKGLVNGLDDLAKRLRVKKQDLFLLALASFVDRYQ